MYQTSSKLDQRRRRQLWLSDLPINVDWDDLPDEEIRANLVLAKNHLESRLLTLKKNSNERKEIGLVLAEMNTEIHNLRAKLKGSKNVPQFFVDVAREQLSKFQFSTILREASIRAKNADKGHKE